MQFDDLIQLGISSNSNEMAVTEEPETNNRSCSDNSMGDQDDGECELTNLNWLTELKNVGYVQLADGPVLDVPMARFNKFLDELKTDRDKYRKDQLLYQTNTDEKPPFNYAHLIGLSLMENGRMTLQQVYDWIQENFAFYRICNTNWQSSIRHNLSLGFFFKNTARGENERGKGGYWELALDSRKTEWKRSRKSRKNITSGIDVNGSNKKQSYKSNEMRSQKNSIKSKSNMNFNAKLDRNKKKKNMRSKKGNSDLLEIKSNVDNVEPLANEEILGEVVLSVETSSGLSIGAITEDTPVEFVDEINLNSEIFLANEVPQPIDDIEIPFFFNNSPNVIVEPLPYNLPPLEEYNFTSSFNEQKIFEDLLEYENELL